MSPSNEAGANERGRDTGALAQVLREAREKAGLSQRRLAARMGVSWVTVSEAERGRDARHSTLMAYVGALPSLRPSELLLARRSAPPPASSGVWEFYRRLFGFSAKSLRKAVTILPGGDAVTAIEVRGVRTDRGSLRDPKLRGVLQRSVFLGRRGTAMNHVVPRAEDLESGASRVEVEGLVHEFRFPRKLDRLGFTYRLRQVKPGLFGREAVQAAEAGREGPFVHGTALAVEFPVQTLQITVQFPNTWWPDAFRSHAWPTCVAPEVGESDLMRALHPVDQAPTVSPRYRRASVRIERPLIEMQYGIAWDDPSEPEP